MSDASFSENLISAYLDGELSPEESVHVQRMIEQNPAYAQLLEEFQHQSAAIKQLPRFELDPEFASRVMAHEAFAEAGRDKPSTVALSSAQPVESGAGRERWVGAVASIGALAAMILVIMVLPLFNSPSIDPRVANLESSTVESKLNSAAAAAPAAAKAPGRDREASTKTEPLMSKGDSSKGLSGNFDGANLQVTEKAKGTQGDTFGDASQADNRARRSGALPGQQLPAGKDGEMSKRDVAGELARSSNNANAGMGFGEAAGEDNGATEQMILSEGQAGLYALDDSGGPFHSVNVMQIDLPTGDTERQRVYDLLQKHQVALPAVKESAQQKKELGQADLGAPLIYYVLADKTQMTGFAMDLSKSSSAVIAMYRMGASNRQKVGQYLQSPLGMQQAQAVSPDKSAEQLAMRAGGRGSGFSDLSDDEQVEQAEQVQQVQQVEQVQQAEQLQQLQQAELRQQVQSQLRFDNSIGVPMDSIIVQGGGVVAGGSGNPQEQLSSSYFAQDSDKSRSGNNWFGSKQGGGLGGAVRKKGNLEEAENEGVDAAQAENAQQQIVGKIDPNRQLAKPTLPGAPTQGDFFGEDRSVQVYLLIVQSRNSPDSNSAAEPAAEADKRPDQVPQSKK